MNKFLQTCYMEFTVAKRTGESHLDKYVFHLDAPNGFQDTGKKWNLFTVREFLGKIRLLTN